jgi:hypothetical protein
MAACFFLRIQVLLSTLKIKGSNSRHKPGEGISALLTHFQANAAKSRVGIQNPAFFFKLHCADWEA